MDGTGEYRICEQCQITYRARHPNQKYCHYKCYRRAADRRRREMPLSANWVEVQSITPASVDELLPSVSNTPKPYVPTPEELEHRRKQEELRQYYPPISGSDAIKAAGYTTKPATPTEEKKHEEGKD